MGGQMDEGRGCVCLVLQGSFPINPTMPIKYVIRFRYGESEDLRRSIFPANMAVVCMVWYGIDWCID